MVASQEPGSTAPAPWRSLFLEHIGTMKLPTFVLSTLHPARTSGDSVAAAHPRARTCVFRGLWAELPPAGDRNPAPRNPPLYASDLPAFTTDARMQKAPEIAGSGGGGPVEAVFWAPGAQTQWRVRGAAWVLGPDADGEGDEAARAALLARMRRRSASAGEAGGKEEEEERHWSWAREVTGHFGNLAPGMRGSFRNPPPGTPRNVPPGEGEGLGQKVEDLEDPLARENFRVVVIVPEEVDQVDLSDPEDVRRYLYTYVGPAGKVLHDGAEIVGEWEKVELWP
ncbi:Zn 2cys6 transcription factor [Pleurostoma richardsiae]|uniref:Zn 2cys6 transcription factor n=1 Tax=Pleurostoma richardsiae TaxID=41990 RepID=A0AA38R768_9PEZI|nr:Zn 2cys6 transcription factor [Pleurostoma richardsiae]